MFICVCVSVCVCVFVLSHIAWFECRFSARTPTSRSCIYITHTCMHAYRHACIHVCIHTYSSLLGCAKKGGSAIIACCRHLFVACILLCNVLCNSLMPKKHHGNCAWLYVSLSHTATVTVVTVTVTVNVSSFKLSCFPRQECAGIAMGLSSLLVLSTSKYTYIYIYIHVCICPEKKTCTHTLHTQNKCSSKIS